MQYDYDRSTMTEPAWKSVNKSYVSKCESYADCGANTIRQRFARTKKLRQLLKQGPEESCQMENSMIPLSVSIKGYKW